jgi:hypothetical protein
MTPSPKSEEASPPGGDDLNAMSPPADQEEELVREPPRSPKFDQNKLEFIYDDDSPPKVDSNSPPDQATKANDAKTVTVPPPPAAATTSLPTAPVPGRNAPIDKNNNNTDLFQHQHFNFPLAQELIQQGTYAAASEEIKALLSTVRQKDNITVEDFDNVHRTFDAFMSSHPLYSKTFIAAKKAQQQAMAHLPELANAPGGGLEALLPAPPSARVEQEPLLIHGLNLPFPARTDPTAPPPPPLAVGGGSDGLGGAPIGRSDLMQDIAADPTAPPPLAAGGGGDSNGLGGALIGRNDLMQDVAAAYRRNHRSQSSQTKDTEEEAYINTLRNHLLDKANIDSAAVEVLQHLSTGGVSGGGSGGSGGKRKSSDDKDSARGRSVPPSSSGAGGSKRGRPPTSNTTSSGQQDGHQKKQKQSSQQ